MEKRRDELNLAEKRHKITLKITLSPRLKKRQVRKKQPKHYLNLTGFLAFSRLMID